MNISGLSGIWFNKLRPLQKSALVVAAVCERRDFEGILHSIGAHRAPLQDFCRGLKLSTAVGAVPHAFHGGPTSSSAVAVRITSLGWLSFLR